MSEFDVSPFEMDDNSLSETDIEAVLAGDQTAGPDALHDLISGLRERFEASTDVPVGAALAEFIDVVDLTTTSTHTESRRNRKMITGIGTFIATTTGKIVLGTTVAAASMGAAHAVDMVEMPGLPESSAEVIVVDNSEDSEETVPTQAHDESNAMEDEDTKEDETKEEVIKEEAIEKSDGEDGEGEDGEGEDTEHRNHGQMISEFATSTELEGCEKGQAISELASSKHDDEDQDESDDAEEEDENDDEDELDDDSKDHPCKDDDLDHESEDSDHEDEDEDEDHEDHDEEHRGNGKAKGKSNKPDHDDDDDDDVDES